MLNKQWPCTLFCFTCESKSFYWLIVHLHFSTFCVLCGVKDNRQKKYRTKTYNEETVKFPNQFALSTQLEQTIRNVSLSENLTAIWKSPKGIPLRR